MNKQDQYGCDEYSTPETSKKFHVSNIVSRGRKWPICESRLRPASVFEVRMLRAAVKIQNQRKFFFISTYLKDT